MKKYFTNISKGIYILTYLCLCLPAFMPACSHKPNEENIDSDTTHTKSISDSLLTFNDNLNNEKSDNIKKDYSVLLPDGENQSFFGFLFANFEAVLITVFIVFVIYSGILRWFFESHLLICIQLFIGLISLSFNAYIFWQIDIMWGYWIVYFLTLLNLIFSCLTLVQMKKV